METLKIDGNGFRQDLYHMLVICNHCMHLGSSNQSLVLVLAKCGEVQCSYLRVVEHTRDQASDIAPSSNDLSHENHAVTAGEDRIYEWGAQNI